jgi:hypothetical protein
MNERGQFSGSCLCGAVRYAFDSEPKVTLACHCSSCRKATGSAFGVWSLVDQDSAPALRIAFHAHAASKADWYEIADAIPQHDEEPAKGG